MYYHVKMTSLLCSSTFIGVLSISKYTSRNLVAVSIPSIVLSYTSFSILLIILRLPHMYVFLMFYSKSWNPKKSLICLLWETFTLHTYAVRYLHFVQKISELGFFLHMFRFLYILEYRY